MTEKQAAPASVSLSTPSPASAPPGGMAAHPQREVVEAFKGAEANMAAPASEPPDDSRLTVEECQIAASILADHGKYNDQIEDEDGGDPAFKARCSHISRVLALAANRQGLARPAAAPASESIAKVLDDWKAAWMKIRQSDDPFECGRAAQFEEDIAALDTLLSVRERQRDEVIEIDEDGKVSQPVKGPIRDC